MTVNIFVYLPMSDRSGSMAKYKVIHSGFSFGVGKAPPSRGCLLRFLWLELLSASIFQHLVYYDTSMRNS
ncbi:hypothetical protein [Dapis sp. BLCC M126]|uniref:hypothetical protein n=1 Tax=Dapis sp. BLCC M126 TaxID=3400189 RepID=UPI003CFB8E8A